MVTFLTDLADQAVVLPLVVAIAMTLAAQGWPRGAAAWLGAVGVTFGVMLGLKIVFLGCQPVFRPWGIVSPSGHAAAATIVTGGLMTIATRRMPLILAASAAMGAIIGATRLRLGVHAPPEVMLGLGVGLAGVCILARLAGPAPALRPWILAGVVLGVIVALHGMRLPAEGQIRQVAVNLGDFIPACR